MVQTIVNRPYVDYVAEAESGGGDVLVEVAGYVPKETQLQMLMQAGKNLEDYYTSLYPEYESINVKDDPDAVSFDPTGRKDYDIFDFHRDLVYVEQQFRTAYERDDPKNKDVTADLTGVDGRKPSQPQPVSDAKPPDPDSK